MSSGVRQLDGTRMEIGQEFAGYRVSAVLGRQSGIGRVYEATRLETGDAVALKVFKTREMASPLKQNFFARTVATQARLSHPNVASIIDSGTDPAPFRS